MALMGFMFELGVVIEIVVFSARRFLIFNPGITARAAAAAIVSRNRIYLFVS